MVEVAERDAAADSVRVKGSREFTIGARAASKVLVRAAEMVLLLFSLAVARRRPGRRRFKPAAEPFRITDNSFLVEEAFNQEAGIFQNIFNAVARRTATWAATFTQEWPARLTDPPVLVHARHGSDGARRHRFGDMLINYRYQATASEGPGRPAFSPRLSLILPTEATPAATDSTGLQFNLPFSKQTGDVYWHWNAG